MAYNPFGRLIKMSDVTYTEFLTKCVLGNLVFAEVSDSGEKNGKWIYANGIEYHIADAEDFAEKIAEIEQHLEDLDSSVDRLDTSVNLLEAFQEEIEEWKGDLLLGAKDNVIAIEGIDGDVTIAGSNYVDVSTKDDVITVSIDGAVKHADDEKEGDELLATKGYVDQEVTKAQGDLADLSTYVHDVIDASIAALDASTEDQEARLLNAIVDTLLEVSVENNKATATLATLTDGGDEDAQTMAIAGDEWITISSGAGKNDVSISANVSNSSTEIADASSADNAQLASDYAVREYVKDQLGDLANAMVFRGGVASEDDLPTDAKIGDTYVLTAGDEAGDLFIWNGEKWVRVERNLDGAVTAAAPLTADKVVLGAGKQGVKTSEMSLGTDDDEAAAENTLATEKWVEGITDDLAQELADLSTDLNKRIDDVSLTAEGDTYVNVAASRKDDTFHLDLSINYVDSAEDLAAVEEAGKLVDALAVKEYVDAAGGELGVEADADGKEAKITLTSAAAAEGETGDLGTVNVASADVNLSVAVEDDKISLDLSTCTLADASAGKTGLALAEDVHAKLVEIEDTWSTAIETVAESVGLDENLAPDWKEGSKFEKMSVVDAVESLDASLDDAIKALDSKDTEVVGQVVVEVSEEDGIVSRERRAIKVNDKGLTLDGEGKDLVVVLDGEDLLVGGESVHAEKTIEEAIVDLSTAIDEMVSDAVMAVEGDEVVPSDPTQFVGVHAVEDEETHVVTLDSSLLIASPVELEEGMGTAATATGLATDAYVKDYVAYTLAWEVIE